MSYYRECVKKEDRPLPNPNSESVSPDRVQKVLRRLEGTPDARLIMALVFKIEMFRQTITALRTALIQSSSSYKAEFRDQVRAIDKELEEIFSMN